MFFLGIFTPGESVSLERKIESSIFLCIPRDLNILGKSCTTFVIVKIVRNLSRGRSPCQRVNHVKSGVIYFSAFIFSYDTIHVSGTIHTWNRDLTFTISNIIHNELLKILLIIIIKILSITDNQNIINYRIQDINDLHNRNIKNHVINNQN